MDDIVYFGARIFCKCEKEKEIEAGLSKGNKRAGRINNLLWEKRLYKSTKLWIRKTIFRPMTLHGCESGHKQKITGDIKETAKERCLEE